MMGAPIVYLNHRGGLAGLGQSGQFTEEALFALQAELQQVRGEREFVESQIEAIKTGRPPPSRRPVAPPGRAPAPSVLPGGSVAIPGVGRVPVLALGAVAAAVIFFRRK